MLTFKAVTHNPDKGDFWCISEADFVSVNLRPDKTEVCLWRNGEIAENYSIISNAERLMPADGSVPKHKAFIENSHGKTTEVFKPPRSRMTKADFEEQAELEDT